MRRTLVALSALTLTLLAPAAPASAASASAAPASAEGWEPAPSAPWNVPAGARCDFPVHGEPVVDQVRRLVLETHADGTVKRAAYTGDLVVRVTNTDTGKSYDADASGSAVVEYRPDRSQYWAVLGPVLVGVAQNGGTLPRGLYVVDGAYTMEIASTGYKTVSLAHATTDDLCARLG